MFVRALKLMVPVTMVIAMVLSIKACDPCTHCAHAKPTPTPIPPNACIPSSSLSVLTQGNNVAAYVPDGNWSTNNLNVELVPIEGSTTAPAVPRTTIVTPKPVNSCSSNSTTGQTVCTSNDTDVYLITGAAITKTLTSGATGTTSFSGGTCSTCGVVVDAVNNLAFLGIGLAGDQSGYQAINLVNNTLQPPIVSGGQISEDIAVDPNLKLLLSPSEGGVYELVNLATGAVFDNATGGELDSAAEDCTTGIALSTDEFTSKLLIADLKQATFVAGVGGAPGTWSAPFQFQDFPEFSALSAGTNGIAIAPNTHIGVVTGEFGGDNVGAIQLPATSGTGTPAVVDFVLLKLPLEPDGGAFETGLDPHTVTAFVSPTSHKAFAIVADFPLNFLAVIDLQAMLSAARTPGTHIVDPGIDPIATGIVRYVKATGP